MFSAVRHLSRADALVVEAPALIASFALAETFYKFHSFTLEAAAFLLTWFLLSGALGAARQAVGNLSSRS